MDTFIVTLSATTTSTSNEEPEYSLESKLE